MAYGTGDGERLGRILDIYTRLRAGHVVVKAEELARYGISERSVRRDLDAIRNYLADNPETNDYLELVYDAKENGYRLQAKTKYKLDGAETLAVCKILLDSRSVGKEKMTELLAKVTESCNPKDKSVIKEMIKNELFHYVQPHHDDDFVDRMWTIAEAIKDRRMLDINYKRASDGKMVKRHLQPAAIIFSEYYFYLAAFIKDEGFSERPDVLDETVPTVYRIDRMRKITVTEEKFSVPYKDRFQEGEFRKRVQFMFTGPLRRVSFTYTGSAIDAVLDRLPTAKILKRKGKSYDIAAEVYGGQGIEMWLRSQGDAIKNVEYK